MPETSYALLTDFMKHLRIDPDRTDLYEELEGKLATASRKIDKMCGRRFYADDVASDRVFGAYDSHQSTVTARVDDFSSATVTVKVSYNNLTYTTVAANYYILGPDNALAKGEPLNEIRFIYPDSLGSATIGNGWVYPKQLKVNAIWGWPSVPEDISEATLLIAARLWNRKDSPVGVMGFNELGSMRVSRYDPDVGQLVEPYVLVEL